MITVGGQMIWPLILFAAVLLLYPYIVDDVTAKLVARNDCKQAARNFARISAFVACAVVACYLLTFGLGKNAAFTIIVAVLFVFCVETTGAFIGAICGRPPQSPPGASLDHPSPVAGAKTIAHNNPYSSPGTLVDFDD
jgi:hypothetical protein